MSHSFSGGLDKTLTMYDWNAQKETVKNTLEQFLSITCHLFKFLYQLS